jgi:hypothetical protein
MVKIVLLVVHFVEMKFVILKLENVILDVLLVILVHYVKVKSK